MGILWFFQDVRYVVALLLVVFCALVYLCRNELYHFDPPTIIRWFFCLYLVYYMCLAAASVSSGLPYSLIQFGKFTVKVLFFALLLKAMNEQLIRKSLHCYSHVILGLTIFSLATMVLVMFFYIHPYINFSTVAANGEVTIQPFYGLVFYGQAPLISDTYPLARLQGLSGEPGSFALAILPAYFWFLLIDKKVWKLSIVLLGLIWTVSFGALLFLTLVIVAAMLFKSHSWKQLAIHFAAIFIVILISLSPTKGAQEFQGRHWHGWNAWVQYLEINRHSNKLGHLGTPELFKSKLEGKFSSLGERIEPVKRALGYLKEHPMGTGMSLGMRTLHEAVAMGYVLAALESGVLGGVAYSLSFLLLAFIAIRAIKHSKRLLEYGDLKQVLALSVLALLFFGAQRMQPDLSFWQMWVYAMFIWLYTRSDSGEKTL